MFNGIDFVGMFNFLCILASIGIIAIVGGIGWLLYFLYQNLQWIN